MKTRILKKTYNRKNIKISQTFPEQKQQNQLTQSQRACQLLKEQSFFASPPTLDNEEEEYVAIKPKFQRNYTEADTNFRAQLSKQLSQDSPCRKISKCDALPILKQKKNKIFLSACLKTSQNKLQVLNLTQFVIVDHRNRSKANSSFFPSNFRQSRYMQAINSVIKKRLSSVPPNKRSSSSSINNKGKAKIKIETDIIKYYL